MYLLSDCFIGSYPITQGFGSNPQTYAKFGQKGHNGIDFGVPSSTQVVASAEGWVSEVGVDPGGYGNYLKIVHDGYLTLYGHLQQVVVQVKDHVIAGQLIAISDNTGFSSGPHLHFGVAPCDSQGIKTESQNGFSGYIDPNGTRCQWELKNLTAPVSPPPPQTQPAASGDELRSLAVLYDGLKNLRLPDGTPFGNLEGLTRQLVGDFVHYHELCKQLEELSKNNP